MTEDADDAAIDELLKRAVERFRDARGNPRQLQEAIERYLEEGDALDMSPYELRDYFDISSPGLVEDAGYEGEELALASTLFEKSSNHRYGAS